MSNFKNSINKIINEQSTEVQNKKQDLEAQKLAGEFCKSLKNHIKECTQLGRYTLNGDKRIWRSYMYYRSGNDNYNDRYDFSSDCKSFPELINPNDVVCSRILETVKKGTLSIRHKYTIEYALTFLGERFIYYVNQQLNEDSIKLTYFWRSYHYVRSINSYRDITYHHNTNNVILVKDFYEDSVLANLIFEYRLEL